MPYPLLLGIFVAIADLLPVIGSAIASVAVCQVPAVVTVVAALLGGALQGIVGALVAIPAAAALLLLTREVLFPCPDRA